ncbi:DUF4489 domain-containing protein [Clostridium sp. DSM 100503]|uniref:DUF4489 domain-containing protein n=1 Tax=Clostridium sp. DSM 100503 TaxID=2963282 RepID=UPI002149F5E0|nr:DUF4489 domain-containing protein [Clostridium sp. DSM 100503]MCR1950893.1 DUF4489 domain-containing protein [Clostridium sp. DSM 100503]
MDSISKESHDVFAKNYGADNYRGEETCPTIIKCSCPSSSTLPIGALVGTSFTLASLTLDTSCLCDPIVKLEFASNIVTPIAAIGAFSVRVFKQCRGQMTPVPIGPEWIFSLGGIEIGVAGASTFSFFICDNNLCSNDCCIYTVVATVTTVIALGTININNATLGAIATCNSINCKKCCRRNCHCD